MATAVRKCYGPSKQRCEDIAMCSRGFVFAQAEEQAIAVWKREVTTITVITSITPGNQVGLINALIIPSQRSLSHFSFWVSVSLSSSAFFRTTPENCDRNSNTFWER